MADTKFQQNEAKTKELHDKEPVPLRDKKKQEIKKHYFDPARPGSIGSLQNYLRQSGFKDKRFVEDTLRGLYTYSTHRPAKREGPRRSTIPFFRGEILAADLGQLTSHSYPHWNNGIRYLLIIVCFLSKLTKIYPLKNKEAKSVAAAFDEHFKAHPEHKGALIWTDRGKEFLREVPAVLEKYGARTYQTFNMKLKSSLSEAMVKKVRNRIARYLTFTKKKRYVDALKGIETALNSEYLESIGMRPIDVKDTESEGRAWMNQFNRIVSSKRIPPKIKLGSLVRISKTKLLFEKSYTQNWSSEIFKVFQIVSRYPVYVYKVVDKENLELPTPFYDFELLVVPPGSEAATAPSHDQLREEEEAANTVTK